MSTTLPIVCAIDDRYVLPLVVMLESLRQHLRPGIRPVLYLMHPGVSSATLNAVAGIMETHSLAASAEQLAAAISDRRHPPAASFPLLMPELLPAALERALFLDADMLVLGDLEELWQVPIHDDAILGAVVDGAIPRCAAPRGVKGCRELGIPADAPYFNCGVLLVHLERWRRAQVTPRAQHYLGAVRSRLDFLHQEALNAVLWRSWQPLPRRWNLLASHDGRVFGRRDAEVDHPGIVHFAGRLKPWRAPIGGPFNAPYQATLSRVRSRLALDAGAPIDLLYSLYDRTLRGALHPLERALWKWRLI